MTVSFLYFCLEIKFSIEILSLGFHTMLESDLLCLITVSYQTFLNWRMSYLMQLQGQSREDVPM